MKTIYFSFKRSISVIFFLCFLNAGFATTYYISPTGNDATGNGTIGNPWKTLFKACQKVNTSGDIIHVNAGTYTETLQSVLSIGVSIEGDGLTSVIQSTLTALYTPMILLQSTQGTSGNQHISAIKIDGRMTTQWGILINGRGNVNIHDITMVNCFDRGLIFTGAFNTSLVNYATGNSLYNSIITNCGQNNGTGYGCLMIGGQDGLLIYNNTITQNSRAEGLNGWPIKYMDEGHLKNMKMYDNTFVKNMQTGLSNYVDWPFVMELFNMEGGNEIYNNNCIGGGIDLVYLTKGTSKYSVWVHDNNISCPTPNTRAQQNGVTCENVLAPNPPDIRDVIIEHNTFTNLTNGIFFTPRTGTVVNNVIIKNNLMLNASGIGFSGSLINMGENGGNINYSNVDIINNTMIMNPASPMYVGIHLPAGWTSGSISNINIKNNNISGGTAASILSQQNTIPISNLNISNNNFYNNNLDTDFRNGQVLPGYVFANNIHINPTYNSSYTLPTGSPLIDAGINVGLSYSGAAPDMGYAEANSALPIKLINFTAIENLGKNILQWKTATEINSAYFNIERSSNGQDYEVIGTVNAAGFSSVDIDYSFTDVAPLAGLNYYRLAMVDKDNSKEYSNIVFVSTKNNQSLNIVTAQLSSGKKSIAITIASNKNQKVNIVLFDANGSMLLNTTVLLQKGLNTINKNTTQLSAGIYYVQLVSTDEKLVKNILSIN